MAAAHALMLLLIAAPLAQAQTAPKPKKKHATPAPSTAAPDASAAATSTEAAPAAPPAPTPSPAESAPPPAPPSAPSAEASTEATRPAGPDNDSITNTTEDPNKRYYFVGLRYRGTIIPKFIENIFVDDGATIYSNSIGAEFDIRKGGQSMIPWIQYTDYNTGDILFLQKGKPDAPNNYSVVNSSLKAIYIGVDELWTVPIANHLDFEWGFGVGLGAVFGTLTNNWVSQTANGPLAGSNGNHYTACSTTNPPPMAIGINACDPGAHTDPNPHKVGGYHEPNWFSGGSVPTIFPHISFPQLSLRYKPIKQLETRLGIGFSLTGFWFGLSADYGLERKDDAPAHPARGARHETRWSDTLEPL